VTLNVALVEPAGTVTLAGTVAALFELESVTLTPPVGAALVSVTVPDAVVPPVTAPGVTPRLASDGGLMASDAETVVPL
jgi:hypothetical protein